MPPLPGGEFKVRYLTDPSGDEGLTDQSGIFVPVALYGRHPFSHTSELEEGDDTRSEPLVPGTSGQAPGQCAIQKEPPHLSGRSRAILKEYFDESPSTRFPVGQPLLPLLNRKCTTFLESSLMRPSGNPFRPWSA